MKKKKKKIFHFFLFIYLFFFFFLGGGGWGVGGVGFIDLVSFLINPASSVMTFLCTPVSCKVRIWLLCIAL